MNDPEDGKRYTIYSKASLDFKCPFCGDIHKKVPKVLLKGINSVCPLTSSNVSFNNRFIYSLLKQTKLNFIREYYDKNWCHYILDGQEKRAIYDFAIWVNDRKIIIEADGGFHYTDNNLSGQTLEESKRIDTEKDKLAKENGFEIYHIKCYELQTEKIDICIVEQMKKYFSDIINFDNIDINKASLDNRRSEYQQVWDLYNAGETSIKLLQEKLQRSKSFIEKALKLGKELNQINYITQYDKGKANNEAILELWESGEFNLDTICEKVGVSKPIVCKYINKKYEETLDPFYTTKAIVVLYCIEEDLYYDKQYLNELYGVANAYASISKSIKRGGTYKGKHWKSIPIQQAYYNIRQGDKSQIIFKED